MLEDSKGKLQWSIDNITEEGFVKKWIMARTIYPSSVYLDKVWISFMKLPGSEIFLNLTKLQ